MNSIEGNTLPKGWVKRKLGEVFKDISSGFACSKRFEKDGGYVHLRTHNISTQGVLNFDKIIQIEESKVNRKSSKIYKGDVIFNNTNSTELVGKTSFVDKDYNYGFSNHLTRIKTSDFSQGKYLTYFLTHLHQQGHFFRICKKWIGQSGVNISMLKDLNYYYPPLEEQKRIVAKIDTLFAKIDKAISLTEESLVQAKNLLPSVLKEVFEKGKADGWEEKKLVDLKESNIIGLVRNAKQQSIDFSFEYVKMNNVIFEKINSEDALNIMNSKFDLKNISFSENGSDALDVDFGVGKITNALFNNITNDAVDFSGSTVDLNNLQMNIIGDKMVSAGENSALTIKNLVGNKSKIAIASKDGSLITLSDITINNTEVGLAAYQKKNEYIGSNILAKNIIINNSKLDFLVDDFSKITLDNKIIINKNPDAKKIINTLNE